MVTAGSTPEMQSGIASHGALPAFLGNRCAESSKVLIVDDDESSIVVLKVILQKAGYRRLTSLTDSREALRGYTAFEPDLILVDFLMPHLNGLQVIESLQSHIPSSSYVPILVLTADEDPCTRQRALSIGASDFISKPFDRIELILRIRNQLEMRFRYGQIQVRNEALERQVLEQTSALEQAEAFVIESLGRVNIYRNDETAHHAQRVGLLSALIGRAMGFSDDRADSLRAAATLHDLGKVGIPDHILLKPGKLTGEEFDQIKTHTKIGSAILSASHFSILALAEQIAFYHHERWDGGGYNHRSGDDIPLDARIVTLADTFDVLTHDRPYRAAWPAARALAEIRRERGRQFDPDVVDVFLAEFLKPNPGSSTESLSGIDPAWALDD